MMATLAAYLDEASASRPANCGVFLCGWIARQRGVDAYPGVASLNVADWARAIRAAGGLVALADQRARLLGLATVCADRAPAGSAGVVLVGTHPTRPRLREACAIKLGGERWAVASNGFVLSDVFRPLAAWGV